MKTRSFTSFVPVRPAFQRLVSDRLPVRFGWSWLFIAVLLLGSATITFAQSLSASMPFPQFGSSYLSGTTIGVRATATTPASTTITKVEFYYATDFFSSGFTNPTNGTKIGEDDTAPYSVAWIPPAVATGSRNYQVRAVVTNSASNTAIQGGTGYANVTVYAANYVSTRNWYVSAVASATNTAGTEALPLNTIQKAADRVAPGDTIFVMAGTYSSNGSEIVNIRRTGTPTRSIVFMPYKTDKPVLVMGNNNWRAFNVLPASAYLKIQGFEVIGNNANVTLAEARQQPGACEGPNPRGTGTARFNGSGIAINGGGGNPLRPHHIVLSGNTVHDCGAGGIGGGECDYVTIENNIVYNNAWYTIYGASGIGFLGCWNYDDNIDTPRIIIRNNRSFGNILFIAWNIDGTGNNCRFFDGNGIILDNNNAARNGLGAFTGRFLVENNVTYLNGGRGINVNYSDNATIVNNTTYQNGQSDGAFGIGIDNELIMLGSMNLRVYNNIFYGKPDESPTSAFSSSNIVHNNNLTFTNFRNNGYFTGGQNIVGQDPQFVDAAKGDFRLKPTSPALNAGSSVPGQFANSDILGVARPQGAGVDMGAFEQEANNTVPGPFTIEGVTTVSCSTISAGMHSVSFTPRYAGLSGQPINFSVVNELAPTTNSGPYTLSLYTDNPVVTLKAVQTGTPTQATFSYNWLAACTGSPFAITAVTTVSCSTISAGMHSVSFTPRYAGLSGQPVSFSVVNELSATTTPGPYTLSLYTDNPVVTLKAVQTGTPTQATFSYNWLTACTGSGRLGSTEPRTQLGVRLLGNPVQEQVVVEIRGAGGQSLHLRLTDSKGRTLESRLVEPGTTVERHVFDLRRQATGILLLRVSTNHQTETVTVLKH